MISSVLSVCSRWPMYLVWALFLLPAIEAIPLSPVDLRCLLTSPSRQWAAGTTVLFPDSEEFIEATERWTIFRPPTYSAVIAPTTEEDIVEIVRLATRHNIPILARGAGHSYTTTIGDFRDGLSINLNQLNAINVDSVEQTVTIGPGVTAADIFDPLYDEGFEIQTGSCSCPSLIGVTLGGGVGRLQGHHGLMIDALVSMRVITANAEMIEVSRDMNPDLFWAMRGAGANFGIVTSATYTIHPLTNGGDVLNVEWTFNAEESVDYFRAVETFNGRLPAQLASLSVIQYNAETNRTQVLAGWSYFGPEEEGLEILAPLLALRPPDVQSIVPWNRLTASAGGGVDQFVCQGNTIRDLYNLNLKNYSASTYSEALAKMSSFYQTHPGGRNSVITLEFFPNRAMAAIPLDDSAFRWRDATGYVNPTFIWTPGDNITALAAGRLGQEVRRDFAATSGYDEPIVFVNYARGDEKLENIYGRDKLPRLSQLKKTWDPNHVFSYNNRLPTEYPDL